MGDATNVVVIVKEGLTSSALVQNVNQYKYLGNQIKSNSLTYVDVEGGFDTSAYEGFIHAHQKYTLESLADLDNLSAKVVSDLKSTNALFKVTLLTVSADISNAELD